MPLIRIIVLVMLVALAVVVIVALVRLLALTRHARDTRGSEPLAHMGGKASTTMHSTATVDHDESRIDFGAGEILLEELEREGLADGLDTSSLAALEHFEFTSLTTDGRQAYTIRNKQTGQKRTYTRLDQVPAALRVLFHAQGDL